MISTRTCVSGGKKCLFFGKFGVLCFVTSVTCVSGGKKCLFFWKIWRALLSCYLRFEIRTFALCAYHGVRIVRFSENLARSAFLLPPFSYSPFCLITDEFVLL